MPVIILGGIYGGIFTPTEASVVAVFYALIVGLFIYRETKLCRPAGVQEERDLPRGDHVHHRQRRPVRFLITRAGVPALIGAALVEWLQSPAVPAGREPGAVPDRHVHRDLGLDHRAGADPGAGGQHFGIDPVHFGIIMVVNLALGMITPPFGVNLFAACTVARIPLDRWSRG